jgi:hypothetical protein
MNRNQRILVSLSAVIFCLASSVSAAVFERDWKTPGDGLLTFDDVNKLEWLDLTETDVRLFHTGSFEDGYQRVVAETLPGKLFDGFDIARSSDITALAESAGINTSTDDYATNQSAVNELMESLDGSVGFIDEISSTDSLRINGRFIRNEQINRAGLSLSTFINSEGDRRIGVFLFRNVPEPSSISLALVWSLLSLPGLRRRRSSCLAVSGRPHCDG